MRPVRAPAAAFIGFVVLFAIAAGLAAWARGSWLDEYWSWHLSGPQVGLKELADERWRRDTHPPLANLLYWLTRQVGADSLPAARLVLNLAALAFLTGVLLFFRRRNPEDADFAAVFGIAVLGLAGAAIAFPDFRSYFWQIAAAAGALAYAHWLMAAPRPLTERWSLADAVGAVAILASLWLHFVTALLMAAVLAAVAGALWLTGRRRAAVRLALLLTVGASGTGIAAAVQMEATAGLLDVRWIGSGAGDALGTFGARFGRIAAAMSVPLLAMLVLARPARLLPTPGQASWFAAAVGAGIAGGAMLLLIANSVQPLVIERYLLSWSVMAAAVLAAILAPAVRRRPAMLVVLTGWAALLMLWSARTEATRTTWDEGAAAAVEAMGRCPTTRLYAAPHWRFGPFADSRSAALESPVAAEGFRLVAARAGVPVTVLDQRTPVLLPVNARCPTLIWTSNLFAVPVHAGARRLLELGHVRPSRPAEVRLLLKSEQTLLIEVRAAGAAPALPTAS